MKVISADMTLDRITVIVNSFIEMKNAEAFLIDTDNGTILAHRDSAKISTQLGAREAVRLKRVWQRRLMRVIMSFASWKEI